MLLEFCFLNSYRNDLKHIFQLIKRQRHLHFLLTYYPEGWKLQDFTVKDRETAPDDGGGELVEVSMRGMHGRKYGGRGDREVDTSVQQGHN